MGNLRAPSEFAVEGIPDEEVAHNCSRILWPSVIFDPGR